MSMRWSGWVIAIVILAAVLVIVATVAFWIEGDLLSSDVFGAKASAALTSPVSRNAIAGATVDAVLQNRPIVRELVRSPAEQAIGSLLAAPVMSDAVTELSSQLHRIITVGDINGVAIRASRVRDAIAAVVSLFDRTAAESISAVALPENISLLVREDIPRLQELLRWVPLIGSIAILVAAGLYVLAFWKAPRRSKALLVAGTALCIGALIFIIVVPALRPLVSGAAQRPVGEVLLSELFGTFVVGLLWRLWIVFGCGILTIGIALWFRAGRSLSFAWFRSVWSRVRHRGQVTADS